MKAFPLQSMNLEAATKMQFKLVDSITKYFNGYEILQQGDLGVHPSGNQPETTRKVERVLAEFFEVEDACFVRGAGTAAIREAFASVVKANDTVLVHEAPVYSTTITSFEMLGIQTLSCNFNDLEELESTLRKNPTVQAVLVQYTRQQLADSYDMEQVITTIKNVSPDCVVITDDNYAVMKVPFTGAQLGADLSCFSMFKLLGPQGIGCVIGNQAYIETIRKFHYSGGSQVQGFEALDAMRSLVYAPVSLAIQATQIEALANHINTVGVKGVAEAVIVNAQSKVVCVRFDQPIAKAVLEEAAKQGAAAYPVGAESKFEVVPMFYRVSKTMLQSDDQFESYWIRINPMRSGHETVLRILESAVEQVLSCL